MDNDLKELMKTFARGFYKADHEILAACLSEDFVWHQHSGTAVEAPDGKTILGIDGMLQEISWRRANWHEVRFNDVVECQAGDRVLQTFRINGVDENGKPFNARAVDIYTVADGRLSSKDTYWKYFK